MKLCVRCNERPAVACDECRRALALLDHRTGFGSIARHPEQGSDCRLCERGGAELCVECLCGGVLDARLQERGPYAGPTPEQFAADEQRAAADVERLAAVGADGVHSMYDRTPAAAGPSWCRIIGW